MIHKLHSDLWLAVGHDGGARRRATRVEAYLCDSQREANDKAKSLAKRGLSATRVGTVANLLGQ